MNLIIDNNTPLRDVLSSSSKSRGLKDGVQRSPESINESVANEFSFICNALFDLFYYTDLCIPLSPETYCFIVYGEAGVIHDYDFIH